MTIVRARTNQQNTQEIFMAQNHYVTKTKRRQKSGKRKDPSKATMATLRQLAAADAKKSSK
jgi:hypothetical protein